MLHQIHLGQLFNHTGDRCGSRTTLLTEQGRRHRTDLLLEQVDSFQIIFNCRRNPTGQVRVFYWGQGASPFGGASNPAFPGFNVP